MTLERIVSTEWVQEWGVLALVAIFALPLFTPRVYASDEIKYFAGLRSVYFDHDLHYENEYAYFVSRDPVAHAGLRPYMEQPTPTGYRLNDAPIGSAIMWAPAYVVADGLVVVARALGATVPRDGFSWPYVWAVCLASLAWGTGGLFLCYRLCRAYVGRVEATWGVLAVWFASPLVFYLYITPAMSHANSLFSVALFLWVWHVTRPDRTRLGWAVVGVSAALMVLVRELNWLVLLVLAVDELSSIRRAADEKVREQGGNSLAAWFKELVQRSAGYLVFGLTVGALVAPQFYVYQTLNGTLGPTPFIVEKFSWLPIHAVEVLFSGFHGLFSWHPVTLVGVIGLVLLWRRSPTLALALGAVFVAQVIVIGSYETWWGGASFGARRFVNCTAIFAVGVSVVFAQLRGVSSRMAGAVIVLLILWNFGLAVQYSVGLIPRDAPVRMTQVAYNQIFEVPPRIARIAWRFAFDRSSLYRTRS